MEPTTTVTAGTALRLGWRQTFATALEPALLIGARSAQAVAEASLGPALILALAGQRGLGVPILRGLGLVALVAEILAGLALAFAGSRSSARLRGGEASPADPWALRGLAYFFFGGLLRIVARAWIWVSLAAAGGAFFAGMARGGGVPGAAAFALALTISLPLLLVASTWTQVGLARASARGEGYLSSLFDSAGSLARRLWAPIGIVILTGIAGSMASAAASGAFSFLGPGFFSEPAAFSWARAVASGALGAFLTALGELWALNALISLQAGEAGALDPRLLPPPPPPPAPIVEAQPVAPPEPQIIEATPVEPPPAAPAPEPIVEALPVEKKGPEQ